MLTVEDCIFPQNNHECQYSIMALSNWDIMAFGPKGEPCNGEFHIAENISVDIYKNWLYLRDANAWHDNVGFIKPTIMSINSGVLQYGNAHIYAERFDYQSSVFVLVEASHISKRGKYKCEYMGGIGCSSYLTLIEYAKAYEPEWYSKIPWDLVDQNEVCEYTECVPGQENTWGINILGIKDIELGKGESPTTYVGVTDKVFQAYIEWLKRTPYISQDLKKWIKKIQKSPQRFNQGDAHFVGYDKASTLINQQEQDSILSSMFKTD